MSFTQLRSRVGILLMGPHKKERGRFSQFCMPHNNNINDLKFSLKQIECEAHVGAHLDICTQ